MNIRQAAASWSGGKDSCLACYKAVQKGITIQYLVNFIAEETDRVRFHGVKSNLIRQQADAIGIPILQKGAGPNAQAYEDCFKSAGSELKSKGLQAMVFGDIFLHDQKNWVERVCGELNIDVIEPLWARKPREIVEEFIDAGFKAVVTSARSEMFPKSDIGRVIDRKFIDEIEDRGICPCGENGEYHTFVFDGPLFKKKINITESEVILKKGFWEHWFLDIKKIQTIPKGINHEKDTILRQ